MIARRMQACAFRSSIPSRCRGFVVPLVAVTVTLLIGFVALAIDIGHVYDLHAQMQACVDSSTLSGTSALPAGSSATDARTAEYAQINFVSGTGVTASELTITQGMWDGITNTFSPLTGTEPTTPNALHVIAARPNMGLFFGPIADVSATRVAREAIAIAGAGVCAGIWAIDGIDGDGDLTTDSYISEHGAYGTPNPSGVTNRYPNGDLCSNTWIDLEGGVQIYGDAMYGDGHSLTTSGSSYEIWGVVGPHCCPTKVPFFDMAGASMINDNATIAPCVNRNNGAASDCYDASTGALAVDGKRDQELGDPSGTPRTYYFSSLMVSGTAQVQVVGPTTIYVDGGLLDLGGNGIVNVAQDPKDLILYSTGADVRYRGTADYHGALVAPNATVLLEGTSNYYGTLLGHFVKLVGTTHVHVDETLIQHLFNVASTTPTLVR